MSNALGDMARIGRMILDGDLAELREVSDRIEGLRGQVAALDARLSDRATAAARGPADDLALMNGRDSAWLDWVAVQKADAGSRIAQLMAEREEILSRAKQSFGRAQAIEALQNRAREARLIKQSRQG
jgi:hypothetical protein